MPTHEEFPRFIAEYARLTSYQRSLFKRALALFIQSLETRQFAPGLRVKGIRGIPGVYEMTWAPDGRATFEYGKETKPGKTHIIWRRIGTHDIFRRP